MTGGVNNLRAIPTVYKGITFRSRIEARWALLFDELRIKWLYELEGYQLSNAWYLPDFWLPEWRCFAEVKGSVWHWTDDVIATCRELSGLTRLPLLLLDEIRLIDPRVWMILPDEPCAHDVHSCDLLLSSEHGRIWHEWSIDRHCNEAGFRWAEAAHGALKERFTYRPPRSAA